MSYTIKTVYLSILISIDVADFKKKIFNRVTVLPTAEKQVRLSFIPNRNDLNNAVKYRVSGNSSTKKKIKYLDHFLTKLNNYFFK